MEATMLIAVINQSTLINNNDAQTMCQAIQKQLLLHFCPAYKLQPVKIAFYADAMKVPGYAWQISLIDDDASVPGALGYHTEQGDKVIGFVMAKPVLDAGGVVLYDAINPQNISIASVLSHEVLETCADRFVNAWVDGIKLPQGDQFAYEVCDPVEDQSYTVDVNGTLVSVSDFVFAAWFNPDATMQFNAPFNYLKSLNAPFTLSAGGYMCVRNKGGHISQVFGPKMAEWRRASKQKHGRRLRNQ